jgi:2-polyprenyl-3-methyl-5-hydroxy-6-metoxy-1,4-benzoquinol methylase
LDSQWTCGARDGNIAIAFACAPRPHDRSSYVSESANQMIKLRNFTLVLLLTACLYAQTPASDESVWKQYFAWYQEGDSQMNTPQKYYAKLIAEGMSETQAQERMALLKKLSAQHRSDYVASFFDRMYTAPVAEFNTEPNAFLVSMTANLKPGTALDVEMGQGRNALYLASKGWEVTGFDIAEKGLEVARAEAAKRSLHVTALKSSFEDFDFGHDQWDLIVFSYAWAPLTDPALVERVRAALKPNGVVMIEHPAEDPVKPSAQSAAPRDPTDEINALVNVWTAGFRILRYEDTQDTWDWRVRKARVLRLFAQKW